MHHAVLQHRQHTDLKVSGLHEETKLIESLLDVFLFLFVVCAQLLFQRVSHLLAENVKGLVRSFPHSISLFVVRFVSAAEGLSW